MASTSYPKESAAKWTGGLHCDLDAEPLGRYRKGDTIQHIWAIYSETGNTRLYINWAGVVTQLFGLQETYCEYKLALATYLRFSERLKLISNGLSRLVAIQISVSEIWPKDHEIQILEHLSHGPGSYPGKKHIIQLLFEHEGPNDSHQCLVFEPLGPSVLSEAELYSSNRLPGKLAWEASKQTVSPCYIAAFNNCSQIPGSSASLWILSPPKLSRQA